MWYTILITLVVDLGGLLLVYALLRDRVRRATSSSAQIAELRDEVSRMVVELNQTTDRNIALIEDRIASLNELAAAADKKIGLLRREIEKHDVGKQVYSRIAGGRGPATATQQQDVTATRISAGQSLSVELSDKPDLHQRVVMLHGAGFSPSLIATRVGVPLGEVELIISLERMNPRGSEAAKKGPA